MQVFYNPLHLPFSGRLGCRLLRYNNSFTGAQDTMKHIYTGTKKTKQRKRTRGWNSVGFVAFIMVSWGAQMLFSGCATTGPEKKQKAVSSIEGFHKELMKNLNQITETLTALNQIETPEKGDLYKPYQNFVKQLNRTTDNSLSMDRHATAMATKGREYFDTWEKELSNIMNAELRTKGAERRGELSATFERITRLAQEVQMTYQPFLSDLTDVKTALGNDLTPRGMAAMKPYISKANKDGEIVMVKLQALADAVDRATNALSSRVGL